MTLIGFGLILGAFLTGCGDSGHYGVPGIDWQLVQTGAHKPGTCPIQVDPTPEPTATPEPSASPSPSPDPEATPTPAPEPQGEEAACIAQDKAYLCHIPQEGHAFNICIGLSAAGAHLRAHADYEGPCVVTE